MAITLFLGEGSEEAFLIKLSEWLSRELSEDEKSRAAMLRRSGFGVNYAAWVLLGRPDGDSTP
jgi:hypothetical protein